MMVTNKDDRYKVMTIAYTVQERSNKVMTIAYTVQERSNNLI